MTRRWRATKAPPNTSSPSDSESEVARLRRLGIRKSIATAALRLTDHVVMLKASIDLLRVCPSVRALGRCARQSRRAGRCRRTGSTCFEPDWATRTRQQGIAYSGGPLREGSPGLEREPCEWSLRRSTSPVKLRRQGDPGFDLRRRHAGRVSERVDQASSACGPPRRRAPQPLAVARLERARLSRWRG